MNGGLPHVIDAEACLLSRLIRDPSQIEVVGPQVSAEDFFLREHNLLYLHLLAVNETGCPLNSVSLAKSLEAAGELVEVGGPQAILDLGLRPDAIPAHLDYYASEVARHARRREAMVRAEEFIDLCRDPALSNEELAEFGDLRSGLQSSHKPEERFRLYTAAEFDAADFRLIPGVLAKGQSCIVGAASKGLKTSVCGIDLSLSLACQDPFLGKFNVAEPAKVCVLSGESGMATLRETARRVCRAKGWASEQVGNRWLISADLPRLADVADILRLRALVKKYGIDVLIVDPVYLALGVDSSQAANRFEMGQLLRPLGELAEDTGCTPILIHHIRTASAKAYGKPPELSDLSHAGFAEYGRQWILIGRQQAYQHDGRHKLVIAFGGSAGHSSNWVVDIDEGSQDDPQGRRWDVTVMSQAEAKAAARSNDDAQRLIAHRDRVMEAFAKFPEGETKRTIRDRSGLSSQKFNPIFDEILENGLIESCKVKKGNGQHYDAFCLSGIHWDSVGQAVPSQSSGTVGQPPL